MSLSSPLIRGVAVCVLGLLVSGWAFLCFTGSGDRGFNLSGLWQIEQIEGAQSWIGADTPESRAFLTHEPLKGPLNGTLPALFGKLVAYEGNPYQLATRANALFICLAALGVFLLGYRAGGPLAGLTASVTFIAVPRIWGAATSPGLTALAICALTWAAITMERARDRLVWFVPAVVVLVLALLTTQLAFLLLLPWVYITFFDAKRSEQRGFLVARPLSLWAPLVFPVALLIVYKLYPPVDEGGFHAFLGYIKAFLVLPRVPTLYFGELYTIERLPWHAAFMLTILTVPPALFFLSVVGIAVSSPLTRRFRSRSDENNASGETARLVWALLLLTSFVPLLLGSINSHGVDLLALMIPWLAVFAGLGLCRALQVITVRVSRWIRRRSWARTGTLAVLAVFGWSIFVFAFNDTVEVYPEVESYYNWMIGGVDGASEEGLPRYPQGPTPPRFLRSLVDPEAGATMALLPADHISWVILDRYKQYGLMPEHLGWAPVESAQLIVLRYDEAASGFYDHFAEFTRILESAEETQVRYWERRRFPFFTAIRVD